MTTTATTAHDVARSRTLHRRIRWFVAATISYNVVEAVVALGAGAVASSAALIGFGLDSLVEVLSAAAIAWQFAGGRHHREREHVALRVVAFSFFGLAAVVTVEATRSLLGAAEAQPSPVGIVLAAVSLAIMPTLSLLQRRAGRELGSTSVVADSKQTMICAALSAVLLVGLLANSILGWAWADPVAALVIAAVAVREGIHARRGDTCCAPTAALFTAQETAARTGTEPAITAAPDPCGCCDTDRPTSGSAAVGAVTGRDATRNDEGTKLGSAAGVTLASSLSRRTHRLADVPPRDAALSSSADCSGELTLDQGPTLGDTS